MSADIIVFPGCGALNVLRPKDRALAIRLEGGAHAVRLSPAVTKAERDLVEHFPSFDAAKEYADHLTGQFPALYSCVIDETAA